MTISPEDGGRGGSGWIQCFTGRKFYPVDPDPDEVDIRDIAHSLAAEPRYAGMTDRPLSVAEHSVLLSLVVPSGHALWALLHDASEAYLKDLPRPVKRLPAFAPYREAQDRLMMAVAVRFGLEWPMPAVVKQFDERMVPTEAGLLFTNRHPDWRNRCDPIAGLPVVCMSPHSAELFFLDRYESLTGRRS